jgi:cytoskeleton protein RodZ
MRQKIDIAEVETATKIRAKYLRALENEEFALLPGNTFVKTFLRTYAEYLGLDAQLLVEEYRAEHEPRGEAELQPYVPPARRRPERDRGPVRPRGPAGPPGPGTALFVLVAVVLVIFAILGLTGGTGSKNNTAVKNTHPRQTRKPRKPKPVPKPPPTTVRLKLVPVNATYFCVDRGRGTPVLFQGITAHGLRFKGRHLRVNAGSTSAGLFANGKRVPVAPGPQSIGLDFTPGRTRSIPPGLRPCQ